MSNMTSVFECGRFTMDWQRVIKKVPTPAWIDWISVIMVNMVSKLTLNFKISFDRSKVSTHTQSFLSDVSFKAVSISHNEQPVISENISFLKTVNRTLWLIMKLVHFNLAVEVNWLHVLTNVFDLCQCYTLAGWFHHLYSTARSRSRFFCELCITAPF